MNSNIEALVKITNKSQRQIIGLMSGTSLDGLDIALCVFEKSGQQTKVQLRRFTTIPYSSITKDEIRQVFARDNVSMLNLCLLHSSLGILHGEMIVETLKQWNISPLDIDIIASHGQTVYHAPMSMHNDARRINATLQIGDGDHIAVTTGIITLSDFRQKHTASGGEGAPLAVYGDFLLFSQVDQNVILLNIGGIANFTFLPKEGTSKQMFSTDTGPGNTLIDAFARELYNEAYDANGNYAAKGKTNDKLLSKLKGHSFFQQLIPKTTGPEMFNMEYVKHCQTETQTELIPPQDLMATLTTFTVSTLADVITKVAFGTECIVYSSGGGYHNKTLMSQLQSLIPTVSWSTTDILGIPGDAKEAVLFATLANEALCGGNTSYGRNIPNVCLGKISFPN